MNLRCRQVQRTLLLSWFDSFPILLIKIVVYAVGVISLTVVLSSFIWIVPSYSVALSYLGLGLLAGVGSYELYMRYIKTHPEYLNTQVFRDSNTLNNCDYAVVRAVLGWNKEKTWPRLLASLMRNPQAQEVFYRLNLTNDKLMIVDLALSDQEMADILQGAAEDAKPGIIDIYSFIRRVVFASPFAEVRQKIKLSDDVVDIVLQYYHSLDQASKIFREYWLRPKTYHTGGVAKDWAVSYTPILDGLTSEIPQEIDRHTLLTPLFSREPIIDQLILELSKHEHGNVLMVGEPGSGRTEVFYHLASRIIHYQTNTDLDGLHVRTLDIERLLGHASNLSELQNLLDKLFGELLRAKNVLLFIDGLDALLNSSGELGTVNAGKIIQSYLEDPRIHIVATIAKENYLTQVKPDVTLANEFTVVEIPLPTPMDLMGILMSHVYDYEGRYRVLFTAEGLSELVTLASRYLKDDPSPTRELSLMEQAAVSAHAHRRVIIGEEEVKAVIELKAQVPIRAKQGDDSSLINIEDQLHKRVVGQERPIKLIAQALMRSRAGLTTGNRPIGTFLFLGPTGVGKTETAKTLAASYYGSESRMVRLDLTEYADSNGLEKLLGTSKTDPGALSLAIQKNPSTVVLLDEVEKAHQYVKNAFLQLIDEGRVTTNYGKVLDFTNSIIIATSNAGSDLIKRQVSAGVEVANFEKQLIDQLLDEKIFLPEFINRFDATVVFRPLNSAEITEIVRHRLVQLSAQLEKDKGLKLEVSEAVVAQLAKLGYDPVFGARALERVIKDSLETVIAQRILTEKPTAGTTINIDSL